MSTWSLRDRLALLTALLLPIAVSAALIPVRNTFPNAGAALVLVVVIVGVAANGNRPAGLVAAVSSAVWFDFFLTAPYERLAITRRADIETTFLLLLVGAAVTELAVRGRRQHSLVATDAKYLASIGTTVELVASASDLRSMTDQVCGTLTSLLGLRGCRFETADHDDLPRLEPDGRVRFGDGWWDLDQYGMPTVGVEVVAAYQGTTYGRFVFESVASTLAPQVARQVAVILVNQVAIALAGGVASTGRALETGQARSSLSRKLGLT